MKQQYRAILYGIIGLILLIVPFETQAAFHRESEPIIIQGAALTDFHNVNINQLHAFCYHRTQDRWREIPLQIDERDAEGNYLLFTNQPLKGYLGENDEVVLMGCDVGEAAETNQWISNPESRLHPRYEIKVNDLTESNGQAFVYLYRSSTIPDTLTSDYADQQLHVIYTPVYTMGIDTLRGYINHLAFPEEKWKWGTNVLDRQKFRLNGTIKVMGIPINYHTTEERFVVKNVKYIDGRVRVLRKMDWIMTIKSGSFSIDKPIAKLLSKFYYTRSELACTPAQLPLDYGTTLLRHSIDIKKDADELFFYNPHNSAVPLNGQPDTIDKTVNTPGTFWALITGNRGTILQTMNLSDAPGNSQRLYYCENQNQTDDGTEETGQNGAWGDVGLLLQDSIVGEVQITPVFHFSPQSVDAEWAEKQLTKMNSPIEMSTSLHSFAQSGASVTLLSPNGGEIWETGTTRLIQWQANDISGEIELAFSSNSGLDWQAIGSAPATANQWSWTIPDIESRQCRIRVNSKDNPEIADESDIDNRLSVGDGQGRPGDAACKIEISLRNHFICTGLQFNLYDRPDNLTFNKAQLTMRAQDFEVNVTEHDSLITVLIYSLTEAVIDSSYGPLLEIFYDINPQTSNNTTVALQLNQVVVSDEAIQAIPVETRDGTFLITTTTGLENDFSNLKPSRSFRLMPNYPNPFNSQTRLSYEIPENGPVKLSICNMLGQEIRVLIDAPTSAGEYSVLWDGRDQWGKDVVSGIYFARLQINQQISTQKMVLIR